MVNLLFFRKLTSVQVSLIHVISYTMRSRVEVTLGVKLAGKYLLNALSFFN